MMVWLWAPTTLEVTVKSDSPVVGVGEGVGEAVGEAVGTPEVAVLVAGGVAVALGGDVGVLPGGEVGVFAGGDVGVFEGGDVGYWADPEPLSSSPPQPVRLNAAGATATVKARRIKNSLRSMCNLLGSRKW